ncbi:MAG: trimethylamine methyltransferase family protein, partial [Clostridiales bacterium]
MYIGTQYYSQASPYSMLDKHQIEQIHYASMRILAEKGLVLQHPEAVKMLKKAGATVDGERVFLPRGLVEWALQQAPSGFALYDRNGDLAVRAEDKNVYYGSGSDTMVLFDYETRAAKPWSKKNVQDAVRLLDALENFDFTMSMGLISDVPDEVNTQEQYAAMIRNTIKPHVVVCNNKEDLEDIFNMYIAVRGGKEELRRKPYAAVYNEPTSPLLCTYTAIDKLLLCADYGMPSNFATGGLAGATTPITAAGTILLSNAECLFGLTIQQVYRPGAPFLYGYCNSPIEMRTVQSVYAAPLALQVQVGMCDMAHYYQLPSWGEAGDSVSKVCDEQSAMEAMQLMQVSAMSGCSLIHDGGYMNFGLGFSLEHLMVCNEIIGRIKEFM